jgi:capsule polysaccharide export protein KpsE/RkpR
MAEVPTARNRFHAVPVIGWIARDIAQEPDSLWYALVIVLTLFVLSLMTWGVMVLSLLALATVPVIFILMILITLG